MKNNEQFKKNHDKYVMVQLFYNIFCSKKQLLTFKIDVT